MGEMEQVVRAFREGKEREKMEEIVGRKLKAFRNMTQKTRRLILE